MDDLAQKIFKLCIKINAETPYAAFASYYGHVNSITVNIAESKIRHNEHIYYEESIYTDGRFPFRIERVVKDLEAILEKGIKEK